MKRVIFIYILLCFAGLASAQPDRTHAPEPGKAKKLELGNYNTFKLDNGLTVILVQNHKLPTVSFSLQLDYDPVLEGAKSGTASLAGSLLRSGTVNRTKQEIDEAVDFIGATLNTSSSDIYAAGLKKHTDELLDVMTDILYHPVFPVKEFEKQKKQTLSALKLNSTDAGTIAATVANVLRFGKDHPYGEPVTEETIGQVTLDGVKSFYHTYFRPNVAYLIMIGDLTAGESRKLAQTYFSSWEQATVPSHAYPDPKPISGVRVAVVDKPGAVQSVVKITWPLKLKPGDPEEIPAKMMNNILGGGVFSGRLMMNLREDKAYTYGATSGLHSDRLIGYFEAGAQVAKAVTDSAITQFFYEIRRMRDEPVSPEDLQLNKNVIAGQFARSLENPQTVASFALNTIRYHLPQDYYATYLEKMDRVTVPDIQQSARKYLHPDSCIVLVVGASQALAGKLKQFATGGTVEFYDRYGNPVNFKK
ncbi:MAG: insulinase family protein [Bacteroidales bacterium]|nr:insulinase family protein [Bacteroidales bacterium]